MSFTYQQPPLFFKSYGLIIYYLLQILCIHFNKIYLMPTHCIEKTPQKIKRQTWSETGHLQACTQLIVI